jgi:predicted amidophosphoribosyltransferase
MQTVYSLHKIRESDQFTFDANAYSRFKFGDDCAAEIFGIALAKGFIKTHLAGKIDVGQIVVISSPYSFIPTATFALKDHFVSELNKWLAAQNKPVVQETKIHRSITYKEDYGELDAEQRMNLISKDVFHIDTAFLKNKTLVFLDDIKITGSHERMITKMLHEFRVTNEVYLLYYAELINSLIHPNIENTLNYSSVKSIFDLKKIIGQDRFRINTRLVKYLLNCEEDQFMVFMQEQNSYFSNLLYNMAIGNGYHLIEAYARNLAALKNLITCDRAISKSLS